MFASRKDIIGFDDRWFLIFGIPFVALLVNTMMFGHLLKEGHFWVFGECFPVSIYFTTIFWLFFREVNFYLIGKLPGIDNIRRRQVISIVVIFTGYAVMDYIGFIILENIFQYQIGSTLDTNPALKVLTSIIFTFLIFVIYESFYLAFLLGNSKIEKQKLISDNIQTKLSNLQNQINPHFLFNSLNTLSSLIQEDPIRADKFVTKMAKVYRHLLEFSDTELVTIESELAYLRAYVHLLKERFGDNFTFDEEIEPQLMSKYIIPFSLQITFENCLKHNSVTKEHPLQIRLYSQLNSMLLCIENNLLLLSEKDKTTSLGLANIKKRYAYFTKQEVMIENKNNVFRVCLPILEGNTASKVSLLS